MSRGPSDPPDVERVFELPGRVRYSVQGLKGRAPEAARMEVALRELRGVREAAASPVTGRVLVVFDEELPGDVIQLCLVQLRGEYLPAHTLVVGSCPPKPSLPKSATRFVVGAGAAVALSAAMGSTAAGLGFIVAAAVAAAIAPPIWRRFREWLDRRASGGLQSLSVFRVPSVIRAEGIAELIGSHRNTFVRATALDAAGAVSGLVRIAAMAFTIDLLLGGSLALPFGIVFAGSVGTVALMGIALVMTFVQSWFRHKSHVLWSNTGREIQHDLRVRLYDRVQRLEMSALQTHQRGELLSTLVGDIDNLEKAIDGSWALMDLALSSVALLLAIGFISATAPLWLVIPVPILVALSVYLYPKLRHWGAAVRRRSAELAGQLSNQLDGLEIIKSFTAEEAELERLREASQAYLDQSRDAVEIYSKLPLLLEATILASLVFTYRTNVMLTLAQGLSLGRFQALNIFTGHLVFPMTTMGLHMDNLSQGLDALKRVRETLGLAEEFKLDLNLSHLHRQSMSGDVRYDNVTFSYPSSAPALRNVSLRFEAGATTAVVGLSGSGKTTLVKLLQRLYDTDSGSIAIDGADIATISRHSLRQSIAMVSQDVYLFDRSVLENIRLSRPDAAEEEVVEAARVAQAHEFISALPQGYYTRLGERGGTLSAGQRQRVSIARAVLKDAPIMVFDEATSNLDSNTEAGIAKELRRVCAGRTVILIAHRLATVRQADRIYALENGEVIAEGTHQELVRQPGRYQSLWRDQTGRG